MLLHEVLDAILIDSITAHLGADLVVPGLADLGVSHGALGDVVLEQRRPGYFGHRAVGASIVLEQLLEAVFSLGIASGISRIFKCRGENVRDANSSR